MISFRTARSGAEASRERKEMKRKFSTAQTFILPDWNANSKKKCSILLLRSSLPFITQSFSRVGRVCLPTYAYVVSGEREHLRVGAKKGISRERESENKSAFA